MKAFFLLLAIIYAHWFLILAKANRTSSYVKSLLHREVRGLKQNRQGETKEAIVWAGCWVCYNIPWLNTCLIRSLTVSALLNLFGIDAKFRLGVRKEEKSDSIEAHAWVEDSEGNILCDGVMDLSSYHELKTH